MVLPRMIKEAPSEGFFVSKQSTETGSSHMSEVVTQVSVFLDLDDNQFPATQCIKYNNEHI